jgi:catechol 2,3-dioxygenase-like lactoylglutathione lyase family enzyme
MKIKELDHVVITATDIERTVTVYTRVLGMELDSFAEDRKALRFGRQKINLHKRGEEIFPHARNPLPGSADLCFLTDVPMQQVVEHLHSLGIEILEGPVQKTGAAGPMFSVYIQDPDGNLLEIAKLVTG